MAEEFSSSDDVRSSNRLRYLQRVTFHEPLPLELGGKFPSVTCGYETWGTLNDDASNAVLVCHAISGDSHAARHDADDDEGWWEALIGPGKHIDTDRFFVVCPNILGGCRGSTGPESKLPSGARPYGADFPRITVADMVAVQVRLSAYLGIQRWRAVVGGSLGGHQALVWATKYPDQVQTCVAIATSARLSSQSLAFDVIARNAIQTDPNFADGQYYNEQNQPSTGLAIARMLGHITYLSSEAMDAKFDPDRHDPRKLATDFEQLFSVGSYLAHQGQKFTERFDANSYNTISMAMDLFDLGNSHSKLVETFRNASCDFLVVSFSSDWLFPPRQSRDIVDALIDLEKHVTYAEISTPSGHDGFLLKHELSQFGPLVSAKLGQTINRSSVLRPDDEWILELIPAEASVLDLGCGSGELLASLRELDHTNLVGIEVQQQKIIEAASRGLEVIDYDLNKGLPGFADQQFDFVVLSATLQAVENISTLFDEMLRVGKRVIVSFPNFAYRVLREDYVQRGRSPKASGQYGYEWYDTPNRRFPSIADVEDLCREKQATIHEAVYLDNSEGRRVWPDDDPNSNADTAILVFSLTHQRSRKDATL